VDVVGSVLVARKAQTSERQVHPKGERFSVDDTFKDRVRAELKARGWSQADLAGKISAVPASITNLLKPGKSQSRLVPRVLKVFGWVDTTGPVIAVPYDDALKRIARQWPELTDEQKSVVLSVIDSLASKP
jgi:lambda repressor-like predicted transcriptional regulator